MLLDKHQKNKIGINQLQFKNHQEKFYLKEHNKNVAFISQLLKEGPTLN
jgi:hypothetical protein